MENLRVKLEEKIDDADFLEWIREREGKFRYVVYQGMSAMDEDIDNLELSVRSYNCLKRAGYVTVNDVVNAIERREDLMRVRNLGRRSADEVMLKIFLYNYENLKPEKRKAYIAKIKEMN